MRTFAELCDELAGLIPMTNYNAAKLKLVKLFYSHVCGEEREITSKQLDDGFRDIIKWYKITFPNEADGKGGCVDKGITRKTKKNTSKYQFDNHLNDDSIRNINDDKIATHQDTLLHLLVAMCAAVDECNDILNAFGFAKLHSRNIHHIAVYSALLEHEKGRTTDDNLFPIIKERYLRALDIVNAHGAKNGKPKAPGVIRDTEYFDSELLKWRNIPFDGFDSFFDGFIENNAEYLNWKYNRLMDEHFRLAVLFRYFLSDKVWKARKDVGLENCFSLEDFIGTLCRPTEKEYESHTMKDGKETVTKQVRNIYQPHLLKYIYEDGKYPTREVMIVLWLFKYCFGAMPIVKCPDGFVKKMNKLVKDLNEKKPCPKSVPKDFAEYLVREMNGTYKKTERTLTGEPPQYMFDIYRYLFGKSAVEPQPSWNGADVIAKINEELDKYGWQMLSHSSQFDSAIMILKNVTVNSETVTVRFEHETAAANVYDYFICDTCVPPALAASYGILKRMQDALLGEDGSEKLLCCDTYSAEI